MRKAIFMMLLAVVNSSAMAEWVKIGADENATAYADFSTINRIGNRVKMWNMYDHNTTKEFSGKKYISVKEQTEFDCKEKQLRTTYISFYSGNMGGGKSIYYSSKPNEWSPVPSETGIEVIWKFACGEL